MNYSFVTAHCCKKEMHSVNGSIISFSNNEMQSLEEGAFGMLIPLVDR